MTFEPQVCVVTLFFRVRCIQQLTCCTSVLKANVFRYTYSPTVYMARCRGRNGILKMSLGNNYLKLATVTSSLINHHVCTAAQKDKQWLQRGLVFFLVFFHVLEGTAGEYGSRNLKLVAICKQWQDALNPAQLTFRNINFSHIYFHKYGRFLNIF